MPPTTENTVIAKAVKQPRVLCSKLLGARHRIHCHETLYSPTRKCLQWSGAYLPPCAAIRDSAEPVVP